MISKEMLSSAANAHRSAILTSAVLALPGNGAIMHVVLAVQALAQGLTVPNKVAVSPLQYSVHFVRATLAQSPSNLGSDVGSSMIPTRLFEPLSGLRTSPTSTLHSTL